MNSPKYRAIILKKVTEAERVVSILETISNRIGESYSPSIVLIGLGELRQHQPHPIGTQFIYGKGGKCIGFRSLGGDFIDEEIGGRYESVRERSSAIYKRHIKGEIGDADAAQTTINHLRNLWWGHRNDSDETSEWTDEFSIQLLNQFPITE